MLLHGGGGCRGKHTFERKHTLKLFSEKYCEMAHGQLDFDSAFDGGRQTPSGQLIYNYLHT